MKNFTSKGLFIRYDNDCDITFSRVNILHWYPCNPFWDTVIVTVAPREHVHKDQYNLLHRTVWTGLNAARQLNLSSILTQCQLINILTICTKCNTTALTSCTDLCVNRCLYVLCSTIRLISVWRGAIEGNAVFIVMFCIILMLLYKNSFWLNHFYFIFPL